jgi:hypothetical protein
MRTVCPAFHYLFYLLLIGSPPPADAQMVGNPDPGTQTDSSLRRSLTTAILVYTHSPAADAGLYNGTIYTGYDHHAQGYPFFLSDSLLIGSVYYAGVLYPDISLSYDMVQQIVIMQDKQKGFRFQLNTEQIRYFTLAGHRIIRLIPDSTAANAPAPGFYEQLYKGKATVLARHEKTVKDIGKADENLSRYRQYDTWYLEVNDHYYLIRNDRSLTAAFGAEGSRVRDLLRKNHIRFKKDPGVALAKAAEFYTQSKS